MTEDDDDDDDDDLEWLRYDCVQGKEGRICRGDGRQITERIKCQKQAKRGEQA